MANLDYAIPAPRQTPRQDDIHQTGYNSWTARFLANSSTREITAARFVTVGNDRDIVIYTNNRTHDGAARSSEDFSSKVYAWFWIAVTTLSISFVSGVISIFIDSYAFSFFALSIFVCFAFALVFWLEQAAREISQR